MAKDVQHEAIGTYAGPRGNPDVTFNTAAYKWEFAVGDRVGYYPHNNMYVGVITARYYGADDGNPYYSVSWSHDGLNTGSTVEPGAALESRYHKLA